MRQCVTFIIYLLCAVGACGGERCTYHSTSPNCNKLRQIKQSMDEKEKPCINTYGYACNNWRIQHSSLPYSNTEHMLDYQMNEDVVGIMDSLDLDEEAFPLRILNESHHYYKSCLNAKGSNVLVGFLETIKPGIGLQWPILQELEAHKRGDFNYSVDEWPAEKFDLFALLGELRNYGLDGVYLKIKLNRLASGHIRANILRPVFYQTLVQENIINLLKNFGLSNETVLNYVESIMAADTYLKHQSIFEAPRQTLFYWELKERFPHLQKYLANITIQSFEDNDKIKIHAEKYLTFLQHKQWSSVEKRNICNYIMIKLLMHLLKNAAKDFTKQQCVKELRQQLDLPVDLLYYEQIFKPEEHNSNADIQILFRKVRDYMCQSLEKYLQQLNASHLTEKFKTELYQITLNIGNIPKNMIPEYFDKIFADVPSLDPYNYYSNHVHLLRHRGRLSLEMNLERTHSIDESYPLKPFNRVYPFYDTTVGEVILPFTFLQPLSYHHSLHPIFKWSILGFMMATAINEKTVELIHAENFLSSIYFDYYQLKLWMTEVVYQGYISEQKGNLQPDFTNIPWKNLFFLNVAQIWCDKNITHGVDNLDILAVSQTYVEVLPCRIIPIYI